MVKVCPVRAGKHNLLVSGAQAVGVNRFALRSGNSGINTAKWTIPRVQGTLSVTVQDKMSSRAHRVTTGYRNASPVESIINWLANSPLAS